jgi:hypothetical protein
MSADLRFDWSVPTYRRLRGKIAEPQAADRAEFDLDLERLHPADSHLSCK